MRQTHLKFNKFMFKLIIKCACARGSLHIYNNFPHIYPNYIAHWKLFTLLTAECVLIIIIIIIIIIEL